MTGNGLGNAEDVIGVLDWIVQQPWADKNNMLVMGQSHGGLTTMALGSLGYPGVKGLVNFAGVLRNESCDWKSGVTSAMGTYGKTSSLPSLWFYGANADGYTDPQLARQFVDSLHRVRRQGKADCFWRLPERCPWHGLPRKWDTHLAAGSRVFPGFSWLAKQGGQSNSSLCGIQRNPHSASQRFCQAGRCRCRALFKRDSGRAGYSKFLSVSTPRAFADWQAWRLELEERRR